MNGDIMSPRYSPGTTPSTAGSSPDPGPAAPAPSPSTPAPMKKSKGRGFMRGLFWLILLAAVAGGIYYWQNEQVKDKAKQLADAKSQIDRLNSQNYSYQQQIAALNAAKTSAQVLTVKEWGVKVPLTTPIADMEYSMSALNSKQNAQAAFRTKQLNTMFPNCTTNSVVILRGQAADTFSGTGASAKTFKQQYDSLLADKSADWTKTVKPQLIGTYYYIQAPSGAVCATKSADTTQEAQIIQAIKDSLNKLSAV
jgi:hypothetical protein